MEIKLVAFVMDSHLMRLIWPFLELWKSPFQFVLSTSLLVIGVLCSISLGTVVELRHEYQGKKNLVDFVMDSHLKQFILACLGRWKSAFQFIISASFLGVGILCSLSIGNLIELNHEYKKKNDHHIYSKKSQSSIDNIEYRMEQNAISGDRCVIVGKNGASESRQINEISRVPTNSSNSRLHSYPSCAILS